MKKINEKDLRSKDYRGFDQSKAVQSFNSVQFQQNQTQNRFEQPKKLINPKKLRTEDYKGFIH